MTLPVGVRDLALRLGADPRQASGPVALLQTGMMRLRLRSDVWRPFAARQTIETTSCAFSWHARFWPFGYLRVIDALAGGAGRLDVTALGLVPVLRTPPTAALTKGELLRYLAELPFAPDAMLHNPALNWRVIDATRFAVSSGTGDVFAEAILTLDGDGRVAGMRAEDRPRSAMPPFLPTPWECRFADYRQRQGRWVPFAAEVAWVIDRQRSTYWRGTLTDWSIAMPQTLGTLARPATARAGSYSPPLRGSLR